MLGIFCRLEVPSGEQPIGEFTHITLTGLDFVSVLNAGSLGSVREPQQDSQQMPRSLKLLRAPKGPCTYPGLPQLHRYATSHHEVSS